MTLSNSAETRTNHAFANEGLASKNIGEIVHTIRRAAKVSQHQLAKILETEQSAISRVENGGKNLSLYDLHRICQYFDLRADEILNDQVDYWRLTEKFSSKAPYPARYCSQPFIRYRKISPLLETLRLQNGGALVDDLLSEMGFDEFLVRNPNQKIGSWFEFDLLGLLAKRGISVQKLIPSWVDLSLSKHFMGNIHSIFSAHQNNKDLLLEWYLHADDFESNFKFQFSTKDDSAFTLSARPQEAFNAQPFRSSPHGAHTCSYRTSLLSHLPSVAGLKKMNVKETDCYFKGSESCTYEIAI